MSHAAVTSFPWIGAAAGAVVVVVALIGIVRLPDESPQATPQPLETLSVFETQGAGGTEATAEDLALSDPTPLFAPTPWNVSAVRVEAEFKQEPGEAFRNFPARLLVGTEIDEIVSSNIERPTEVIAKRVSSNRLLMIGRDDTPVEKLASRMAQLEVLAPKQGRVILSQSIATEAATDFPVGDWAPLELLVVNDHYGLVGRPSVVQSSGVEAVDRWWEGFLDQRWQIGARLPYGVYRIRIGP